MFQPRRDMNVPVFLQALARMAERPAQRGERKRLRVVKSDRKHAMWRKKERERVRKLCEQHGSTNVNDW